MDTAAARPAPCPASTCCLPLSIADSDSEEERIIGGRDCRIGSRPYQVALLRNGRIYCGGSLIDPKWVLTAAHCRSGIGSLQVHLGDYNLRAKEGTEQIRRIRKFFVHPGYNRRRYDNDFMLLELDAPAQLNSYVNTINLATSCPSPGTPCIVSGWGTISSPRSMACWGVEGGVEAGLNVYSVSQDRCQGSYGSIITENMFCAGMEKGGIDSCQVRGHPGERGRCRVSELTQLNTLYPLRPANASQPGDSGGPLVCNGQLQGVVSWGMSVCALPGRPGVYANVCKAAQWVRSTIGRKCIGSD
uniref:Peptidase S1 domain-containing protein n=1 Tax=Terrapene triunguis TaxID=2587831 RepID=A0A674IVV1_9SAUR